MIAIPDTGPGLSGFLAHYLWIVYQHFPFEGTWDWLVLFLLLGGAVHFAFLPYVWKSVESDMRYLQNKEVGDRGWTQGSVGAFWGFTCLFFFTWFFSTAAGRTFLDERSFFGNAAPTNVDRKVYWVSLCILLPLVILQMGITERRDKRNLGTKATRSQLYSSRTLSDLYAGGGVFVKKVKGKQEIDPIAMASVTFMESVCFIYAHMLYWYWSNASLALMHCFLLSAILTDCVRMLFVYILHKRTFG